tara:strand:+ start:139 stop:762 length:624 start_codon:yes stop_codon:yes gene_type:complete
MALSSIEGCTLGGLDEGRGHNTRILGFRGTLTLGNDVTATSVHTVSDDGTVVSTTSAGSADALTVSFGHGMTIQVPAHGDGVLDTVANSFKFTFGVVGTHSAGVLTAVADPEVIATSKNNSSIGGQTNAVANANLPFSVQTAVVTCVHVDASNSNVEQATPCGVSAINGNTVNVRITQPNDAAGADIPLASGDKLIFDIVAFATANN